MPPEDSQTSENEIEIKTEPANTDFGQDQIAYSQHENAPLSSQDNPLIGIEQDIIESSQVFGNFVAGELRQLHFGDSRRKLKRLIQRAILDISFEDEERYRTTSNSISGANEPVVNSTEVLVETEEHSNSQS